MAPSNRNHREQKKAHFSQAQQANNNRTIVIVAAIGLTLVLGLYLFTTSKSSAERQAAIARAENGFVAVPLADLGSGQAKFVKYVTSSNKTIRFFVIRSSDGVYRAAADACDVCYDSKKGYYQEGDDLVCRKCGRHFPSKDVNVVTGGCNPDGIPVTVKGDKLLIASKDLDNRAELF